MLVSVWGQKLDTQASITHQSQHQLAHGHLSLVYWQTQIEQPHMHFWQQERAPTALVWLLILTLSSKQYLLQCQQGLEESHKLKRNRFYYLHSSQTQRQSTSTLSSAGTHQGRHLEVSRECKYCQTHWLSWTQLETKLPCLRGHLRNRGWCHV